MQKVIFIKQQNGDGYPEEAKNKTCIWHMCIRGLPWHPPTVAIQQVKLYLIRKNMVRLSHACSCMVHLYTVKSRYKEHAYKQSSRLRHRFQNPGKGISCNKTRL